MKNRKRKKPTADQPTSHPTRVHARSMGNSTALPTPARGPGTFSPHVIHQRMEKAHAKVEPALLSCRH